MSDDPISRYSDQPLFERDDAELLDRERMFDGFFAVDRLRLQHRLFRGGKSDALQREVFLRPPAVGVLLLDPLRRELVLVEQFRVGAFAAEPSLAVEPSDDSPWLLELVAGLIEPGETAEDVARREAREEADCAIQELWPIHEYYSSPGGSNERIHLFCGTVDASVAGGVHGCDQEHEDIRVVCLNLEQARRAMQSGRLNNAMTLLAVQWLFLNEDSIFSGSGRCL